MNFKQLAERMPGLLASGISIELLSSPGLGKSEFVESHIDIMSKRTGDEWGFQTLFLATQTPPDLIGYVMKGERTWDGKAVSVSEPTLPSWMVTREGNPVWHHKHGILLLDEYGQGEADVKRASAELLLNKRLGPWSLPPGWSVVACSNRSSDRSGVTKSFDFVINRRMQIELTPDVEAWKEWAYSHDVSPLSIYFASEHPDIVFEGKVPDKQGPFCTPRSLVMNDRMLRAISGKDEFPDDDCAIELSSGLMGAPAAQAFFVAVRLEREMPKYETIVKNPEGVKVPDKPDARMLVCYQLAHRVKKEDASAVVTYVDRFPKEFGVTFCQAACKRQPTLLYEPAFQKWARTNSSLMAAIAR